MWYKRDGMVWIKDGVQLKPSPYRTEAAILAHKKLIRKNHGTNN